jgi:ABC-type uncharacterized transport system substrate-binding protein
MKRREFITLLGGAATAWPLAVRAQQPAMPVIGFVSAGSPGPFSDRIGAFREGLRKEEFLEGRNVAFEFRWLRGDAYERMPQLAAELVARRVDVIVAGGGAAAAAKAATATIPIVALSGGDPVDAGLTASLNRPEGNLTGVVLFSFSLGPKRLELLREAVPGARLIAVLANPTNPDPETKRDTEGVQAASSGATCCICSQPLLAHRVGSLRRTDSVAIEGIADIRRSLAARRSDANDPSMMD